MNVSVPRKVIQNHFDFVFFVFFADFKCGNLYYAVLLKILLQTVLVENKSISTTPQAAGADLNLYFNLDLAR